MNGIDIKTDDVDSQVLAATFAARVRLAKEPLEDMLVKAQAEWERTQKWVVSESKKPGSFLWFCDEFDLEPSAVRRAIRERAK